MIFLLCNLKVNQLSRLLQILELVSLVLTAPEVLDGPSDAEVKGLDDLDTLDP